MGSDQSSQHGRLSKSRGKNPKRSQSAGSDNGRPGEKSLFNTSSPRHSICSDSDVPYISYATTRPISDDPPDRKSKWMESKPKTRDKHINREKRDSKAKSVGNIVVVKAAAEAPTIENNPLYRRLLEIPPFAPVIRGSLKVPWTTDPEIAEKIDTTALVHIGYLFEKRLITHSRAIDKQQTKLCEMVEATETTVRSIVTAYTDLQKKFAKCAQMLSKVNELSHGLTKCHCTLNQALESIELLNNLLPSEERLEPFVWTTG